MERLKERIFNSRCRACAKCCGDFFKSYRPALSKEELEGLCKLGYKAEDIAEPYKDGFVLRCDENNKYRCVFLDMTTMTCKIWNNCPMECQLYPLFCFKESNGDKIIAIDLAKCKMLKEGEISINISEVLQRPDLFWRQRMTKQFSHTILLNIKEIGSFNEKGNLNNPNTKPEGVQAVKQTTTSDGTQPA